MNGLSIYLLKQDAKSFVKRNLGKIIVYIIVFILCTILAIANVVSLDSISDYFENKTSALFSFIRGEGTLFGLMLITLVEKALIVFLIYVASFTEITTFLHLPIFAYMAYTDIFKVIIVLGYFGVRGIIFAILYLSVLIIFLAIFIANSITIVNSHLRWKYGIKELKCLVIQTIPMLLVYAIIYLLKIISISFGCLFI